MIKCLGPHLGYTSKIDENGMTSICPSKLMPIQQDNHGVISHASECFGRNYRSGTSTFKAIVEMLTKEIGYLSEFDQQSVYLAVELVKHIFAQSCNACILCEDTSQNIQKELPTEHEDLCKPDEMDNDAEETNWFFDESASDTVVNELPIFCTSTEQVICSNSMMETLIPVFSDLWLAIGLQHCIPTDYAFNIKSMNSCNATGIETKLSLPMALALECINSSRMRSHNSTTVFSLNNQCIANQGVDTPLAIVDMADVSIIKLSGIATTKCKACSSSIVIGIQRSHHDLLSRIIGKKSCFQHAVVWDNSSGGSLFGLSEEASRVNVKMLFTQCDIERWNGSTAAESFVDASSIQLTTYFAECLGVVMRRNIEIVFVNDSQIVELLMNFFAQHGIALVFVHPSQLLILSQLLQVDAVEEFHDVNCEHISSNNIKITTTVIQAFDVDRGCKVSISRNNNSFLSTLHSSEDVQFEFGINDGVLVQFQISNNYREIEEGMSIPSAVVICASISCLVDAIEDRFSRCFYRLQAVAAGASVIIGGGLPECLCVAQLNRITAMLLQRSSDLVSSPSSNEPLFCGILPDVAVRLFDNVATTLAVISSFNRVLSEYVMLVGLNNGLSRHTMEQSFYSSLHCFDDWNNPIANFGNKSMWNKLQLTCPLNSVAIECQFDVPVLDVYDIKCTAFAAAVDVSLVTVFAESKI